MKRFMLALFATAALAFGADIDGKWVAKMEGPNGAREVVMKFKADGAKLTGTVSGRQGDTDIQDGKIEGENISFTVVRKMQDREFKTNYKGVLKGGELKLQFQMRDNTVEMTAHKADS
jgi:redox-regulated HSP33 family molecular chaperone